MAKLSIFLDAMRMFGRFRQWMSRILRRIPVLATLAALAAVPALASAASPSYYVLSNPKAHCRSGYSKKTVTITVKKGHHKVKHRQLRCVRKHSSGAGGAGVTFPAGLPTATVTPLIVPTAAVHTYSTNAGWTLGVGAPGVLAGASGHGLTAQLVSGVASGTLTLLKDGGFTYVPAAGASGIVHFTYKVVDLNSTTSKPATVTIDVMPLAHDQVYAVNSSQSLFIPASELLAADVGTGLGPSLVSTTSHGSLTLDGTGATYTPHIGYAGVDSFTYQDVDSSSLDSNTATVTISVGSAPPSVVPQTFNGLVGNTPLQVGGAAGTRPRRLPVLREPARRGQRPQRRHAQRGARDGAADRATAASRSPLTARSATRRRSASTAAATASTSRSTRARAPRRRRAPRSSSRARASGTSTTTSEDRATAARARRSRHARRGQSAASSGDQIFVFTGTGPYTGGITLPARRLADRRGQRAVRRRDHAVRRRYAPDDHQLGRRDHDRRNSTVTGVDITNATGDGVAVSGAGDVVLRNVTISGAGGDGVRATRQRVAHRDQLDDHRLGRRGHRRRRHRRPDLHRRLRPHLGPARRGARAQRLQRRRPGRHRQHRDRQRHRRLGLERGSTASTWPTPPGSSSSRRTPTRSGRSPTASASRWTSPAPPRST